MVVSSSDSVLTAAMAAFVAVSVTGVYVQTRWHVYELLVGKRFTTALHAAFELLTFIEFLLIAGVVVATSKKSLPLIVLGTGVLLYALWLLVKFIRLHGVTKLGHVQFFGVKQPVWNRRVALYRQMPLAAYCLIFLGMSLVAARFAFLVCMLLLVGRFWLVAGMLHTQPKKHVKQPAHQ